MFSEDDFYNQWTEQLIQSMMSFLEDSAEECQLNENDKLNNPLCWAVKCIMYNLSSDTFDNLNDPLTIFSRKRMHSDQMESACRDKDPYMLEINRLMSCSSVVDPPVGSPEYYRKAENYAQFGKEFLDFPTDNKFPQPLDVNCFGEVCPFPSMFGNLRPLPAFGIQSGKYTKQPTTTGAPQQQVLINQTNYSNYAFFNAQNMIQPLMYSNPFLMSQYLNTFAKDIQVNTSMVQQLFLTGGIQERLVYAHMLQQQIQTNQSAPMGSCTHSSFISNGLGSATNCHQEAVKPRTHHRSACNLDGGGGVDNNVEL